MLRALVYTGILIWVMSVWVNNVGPIEVKTQPCRDNQLGLLICLNEETGVCRDPNGDRVLCPELLEEYPDKFQKTIYEL